MIFKGHLNSYEIGLIFINRYLDELYMNFEKCTNLAWAEALL